MSANGDKPAKSGGFFSRWRKKSTVEPEPQEVEIDELAASEPEVLEAESVISESPNESTDVVEVTQQGVTADEADNTAAGDKDSELEDLVQISEDLPASDEKRDSETGFLASWRKGLNKTGAMFGGAIGALLRQKTKIDDDLLEEIETQLLVADVGLETTTHILDELKKRVKSGAEGDLYETLKLVLVDILLEGDSSLDIKPDRTNVLMVVGVNGVGKTTSIGKLANQFNNKGLSTTLAAGDTFRAAAVEQLQVWGERNGIPVIAQSTGADSASVVYDALESSRARGTDILIADTAGRLHNKSNLMEELTKVVRVMQKQDASAPHETLLVLDACTGQNAINQAIEFKNAVPLTGLILTKMDGTAKGGVIFSLIQQVGLPVKFVGLGEGIEDLAEFDPHRFVEALFSDSLES